MEKPFAASRRRCRPHDRGDGRRPGSRLAINWPLAWYRSHNTAKRLIDEGVIGDLIEVHFYDGNRGPLYHLADKVEVAPEEVEAQKPSSWFYRKAAGGGSLLDYLGYGVTLGTWFMDGEAPVEVTCVVDETPGSRWTSTRSPSAATGAGFPSSRRAGARFTDPWTQQPQPKCGFVLVGSRRHDLQLRLRRPRHRADARGAGAWRVPVDMLAARPAPPVEYMLARIDDGEPITGPLDPELCLDRPADRGQRRAFGRDEAHSGARGMSETPISTPTP